MTLRRGDRLPTVAYAQDRLNRTALLDDPIAIDGDFGPETEAAVEVFQASHGRQATGVVDSPTWDALALGDERQVIESIDGGDLGVASSDASRLRLGGDAVIATNYGQSRGLPVVIERLMALARPGRVLLLRFHGHGSPGHMAVSWGDLYAELPDSILAGEHLAEPAFVRGLAPLRSIFGPFASVEMHGCHVGRGHRGRVLVERLSNLWGVPVSAGSASQYGGSSADRFEGPVRSAFPQGMTLKEWARGQTGHSC